MPTFLSHVAVPVAAGLGLGERVISRRLLAAGVLASVLPDVDALGFYAGVPYASTLGHRGATHSLAAAVAVAAVGAFLHGPLRTRARTAFAFLLAAAASHAILDAFTTGGLGVALLWPFTDARFFAPIRFIQVAPLRPGAVLARGLGVIGSEVPWIWAPCAVLALALAAWRAAARRAGS